MKKFLLILGISGFGVTIAADSLIFEPSSTSGNASLSSKAQMLQFEGSYPVRGKTPFEKEPFSIEAPNTLRALDLAQEAVNQREPKVKTRMVRQYTSHGLPHKDQVVFYTGPGIRTDLNLLVPVRVHANHPMKRRAFKKELKKLSHGLEIEKKGLHE